MTDWFRSWHGAPTDPKWVLIARKAGTTPAVASAIAWALFDHASQATPRGSVAGFDCEVYAAWGGLDDEVVRLALAAMADRNMIIDGMLSNWTKRQPSREDGSAERAKEWRERKKDEQQQDERARTQPNANDQQIQKEEKKERNASAGAPARLSQDGFDEWYEGFPNKVGKDAARRAFQVAIRKPGVSLEVLKAGVKRYIASKPPDRPWCNPGTWLHQGRWADQPATGSAVPAIPPASPDDPRVDLGGGFNWPELAVIRTIQRYDENPATWPDAIGWPPGDPSCRVPERLIAAARAKVLASIEEAA